MNAISSLSSLSVVWVLVGKTQHPAYVMEEGETESLIQWATTKGLERVPNDTIERTTSPRSRKPPSRLISSSDSLPSSPRKKVKFGSPKSEKASHQASDRLAQKLYSPQRKHDDSSPNTTDAQLCDVVGQSSSTEDDHTPDKSEPFALVRSAYLQNLAEICHIIMNDGRWRVNGPASETLLRWEDGVDLSAVTYLSRCYCQPSTQAVRRTPCACLLCRDTKGAAESAPPNDSDTDSPTSNDNHDEDEDDDDIRWLYLYSRLFYRRGPWFRIDDVYDKYYNPARKTVRIPDGSDLSFSTRQSNNNATTAVELNAEILESHISALGQLFSDLSRLFQTGLVRDFQDEEECGKTVGVSLLTADMRESVLQKLGGRRKKPPRNAASQNGETANNAIWNQMKQQTSIAACFGGNSSRLLPVTKHVNDAVLDVVVVSILKLSCNLDSKTHLPAAVRRRYARPTRDKIVDMLKQTCQTQFSCFRLREPPLLALLRCCRLFLCANSGPGDMRSDESNGWKSLHPQKGRPPLHRRIRPPGLESWSMVNYAGLLTRFGIAPNFFRDSYLPIDPSVAHAASFQVFQDRSAFEAWECAVELRAQTDYLVQLTELVRYDARRKERENTDLESDGPSTHHVDGDSVDYLMLLSEGGRRNVLQVFCVADDCSSVAEMVSRFLGRECVQDKDLYEWEKILLSIAALCLFVLDTRQQKLCDSELALMESRPWLRHLWWEGVVGYILWDLIPILERFDLYDSAVSALNLLLYGVREGSTFCNPQVDHRLAPLLLTRRARGKAYDRLVIDMKHLSKMQCEQEPATEKKMLTASHAEYQASFCLGVIGRTSGLASIPFSAIRCLARRLKRPLQETVKRASLEAVELGLRYESNMSQKENSGKKVYVDWQPNTDFAVANSIGNDRAGVGSRCAFVGFENDAHNLNVEELAMEAYREGILPIKSDQSHDVAGWLGWHDEGGHIRALFRIICGGPLLGMDWGCTTDTDQGMVHIAPYQGAPFDIHVGFHASTSGTGELANMPRYSGSFYSRRRDRIESFLTKISILDAQEVCDLVFDSVKARLMYTIERNQRDPSLESDLQNIRTLSLIAAGCGGKLLASIFRCFSFDYRHWSGGLPDLLLVRGLRLDDESCPQLVNLSNWIGESFSEEFQLQLQNEKGAAMLADDEFLGCKKVGDSGGMRAGSGRRPSLQRPRPRVSKQYSMDDLPEPLQLTFQGTKVKPETMMVEVKSSNDRLDARQEDWLNILDKHGNARVCKFEDSKRAKRRNEKSEAAALS